jgi:HPt (histidine-containing phosphotransfer) domain-containing protein
MQAAHIISEGFQSETKRAAHNGPAIDLVHLARQTDGDSQLEAELLAMFDRQSETLLDRLRAAGVARGRRADFAHTLKGSALAIGAGRIADAARVLEAQLQSGSAPEEAIDAALEALARTVAEARAVIADLRA